MVNSGASGATVTGSAFRPPGRPSSRTVTGSLNGPLRTTLPLTSIVAPAATSTLGAASSTAAGRTTFTVTAGTAKVRSLSPSFPLAVRPIVDEPSGASVEALTVTVASAAFSATFASGTASPL